jgi:D-inositol-3-phosphate glycosyltransferase
MNVYVRRLAEGLAENEIEVDVFTRHEGGESAKELEFTPGARLITVRAGPTRVLSKAELAGYTPAFARSLACYTSSRKLQYDVIHSHYWLSGLAAQALRTSRQPLVHMFHTLGRVKRHYQPDAGASDPASRDYGELSLLRSGQTVVFSTAAEVDDVERMYGFPPESVAIIPPGVDGDRFARKLLGLNGGPLLLFVGRMDRAKGIDLLLRAAAVMRANGRWDGMKIVVVGGDDNHRDSVATHELDRLNAIARDLGMPDAVLFQGVVPQDRLPLYYAACDVTVVPSRYESFGMVALEAMSSGKPVVGFRSRGLEQTIRDGRTGFLVPSGDVESLAGALDRVLSDPFLASRMGMAARESVKAFSWTRVVERTSGLYSSLLEESSRRHALRSS